MSKINIAEFLQNFVYATGTNRTVGHISDILEKAYIVTLISRN